MENKEKDIFKQAAEKSMEKLIKNKDELPDANKKLNELTQANLAVDRTENPLDSSWLRIEKAMTGDLADRFLKVMETMPDKEFVRVYLKSLEYFKPKIIREERNKEEDKNLTIDVTVMNINENGEIVELNLNEKTNTYE